MTYQVDGVQYVVVAVGAEGQTAELVALRLPEDAQGSAGAARFTRAATSVAEGAGEARLTVTRQGGRRGAVEVEAVVASGTATAGEDFGAFESTLRWSDGEGGGREVVVPILDDGAEEGEETIVLELQDPQGGLALGTPSTATLTLLDDDVEACRPDAHTLCLEQERFRVRTRFRTAAGDSGEGRAVALSASAGYFTFFEDDNVELLVKVLDACAAPFERFWVFAAGLTDVDVTLTVTDTATGQARVYENPLGRAFPPIQDTTAFATCP